jgi:hypothetical protein
LFVAVATGLAAVLVDGMGVQAARADEAMTDLASRVDCEAPGAPGRLRCTLELRAPEGTRLDWADAQVVRTPDFVMPLRARFAGSEADVREPRMYRWGMAVVARSAGEGDMTLRFRAVRCDTAARGSSESRCAPYVSERTVTLRVGR